jgi:hypothetical protein
MYPAFSSSSLFEWVDHARRIVFDRREHSLGCHGANCSTSLPMMSWNWTCNTRLRPFTISTEPNIARHGLELIDAHIIDQLPILYAFGPYTDHTLEEVDMLCGAPHKMLCGSSDYAESRQQVAICRGLSCGLHSA